MIDALLQGVTRHGAALTNNLGVRTGEVRSEFSRLQQALEATLRALEGHATARQVRPIEDLDTERVRRLVSTGELDQLSSREARYVVLSFLDFPAERVAQLLEARPVLRRAFARQALLRWESSLTRSDWDAYIEVFAGWPPSESPIEAPIPLSEIAGSEGASTAAEAVEADTLLEVHRTIVEDWRLQPSWSLTPHVLVEWMRHRVARRRSLNGSVRELLDGNAQELRALLLPGIVSAAPKRQSTDRVALVHGSPAVQVRAVATLLEARFPQAISLDDTVFGMIEPALLKSTFGDPRAVTTSDGWKRVRVLCTQPYDAFLQGLIREDLALFFRHLMREDDRERFWLKYLGSIRRTVCVLDRDAYWTMDHKLTDEAARAALGRVVCTRSRHLDGTCAFCLFFDDIVMVEFSIKGNAGFLYDRQVFEQRFSSRFQSGEIDTPASLKGKAAERRLVHRGQWQPKMELELLQRGIRSDRQRRGGTS
jgi:hypothetical protein